MPRIAPDSPPPPSARSSTRRNSLPGSSRPTLQREETTALDGLTGQRQRWRATNDHSFTTSKPASLEELRERHELAQLLKKNRLRITVLDLCEVFTDPFTAFRSRAYTFEPSSKLLQSWDWCIVAFAIYSVIYVPLQVVLPDVAWEGSETFEAIVDGLFVTVSCPRHS